MKDISIRAGKKLRRVLGLLLAFSLLMVLLPQGLMSATAATPVSMTTQIVKISAGADHVVALMQDGTVWAWGRNDYGQLGLGHTNAVSVPTKIEGLSSVADVQAGWRSNAALLSDGTVWVWGETEFGLSGIVTVAYEDSPTKIDSLSGITQIAVGYRHMLALKDDGKIWSWGWSLSGQLGNGSMLNRYTPVQVTSLSNVAEIYAAENTSFAKLSDGKYYAWGDNTYGMLPGISYNLFQLTRLVPTQTTALADLKSIAGGHDHTVFSLTGGGVKVSGRNNYGQLGDGTTTTRAVTTLPNITTASAVAAGENHSMILLSSGTVLAFGRDNMGQIGNGAATANVLSPFTLSLTGVRQIAAATGGNASYALLQNGELWAWGDNTYKQVSTTTAATLATPTKYTGFPDISAQPLSVAAATLTPNPANVSQTVTFGITGGSAGISGATGTYALEWQRSESGSSTWAAVSGSSSQLDRTMTAAAGDHGAQFRLKVTSGTETAYSAVVTLSVVSGLNPGTIAITPNPFAIGQTLSFASTQAASGGDSYAYQWQQTATPADSASWVDVTATGANQASFTLAAAQSMNGLSYRRKVTSGTNTAYAYASVPLALAVAQNGSYLTLAVHASSSGATVGTQWVVTYDAAKLVIADLNATTAEADLVSSGAIPGTKLTVVSHAGGVLTLKATSAISGASAQLRLLAVLKFRKLVDGASFADITAQ